MPWFDCAVKRPISANTGGVISSNLGLVLHHAVANGSLYGFFNNPGAQVSAHFWVAKSGLIEQYVDSSVVAWHGRQLNSRYVGVETEGCTSGPAYAEPMTDEMAASLARIYAEGAARHGWVNALANADGQRGFGYHRMAVNTACPCDIRLSRRQDILKRAFGPIKPQPEPEPPKKKIIQGTGDGTMTSLEDETFIHVWGKLDDPKVVYHWWQFLPGKGQNPKNNWFVEALPSS